MRDIDADIRHMAICDFNSAIEAKKIKQLGAREEAEIVGNLMAIITKDPSTSVKEVAVRCVELLATRLGFTDPSQGRRMLEGFTQSLIHDRSERHEEVSEMCTATIKILLHAAAAAAPSSSSTTTTTVKGWETGDTFYAAMLSALSTTAAATTETDDQVKGRLMEVLDLLVQLFPGRYVGARSPMPTVLPYLSSAKAGLRRGAVSIVGDYYSHAPSLDAAADEARDAELSDLVEGTILPRCADAALSREKLCGYVHCIAALRAPHGIVKHVPRIVDALAGIVGTAGDEALIEEGDAYIRVREACFNAIEALHASALRYPPLSRALSQHSERLVSVCLEFAKYDPNRMGCDEDDGDGEMPVDSDNDDDEFDVFDADEFEELNNDYSWKVRRAAVLCLGAILAAAQGGSETKEAGEAIVEKGVLALAERAKREDEECVVLNILGVLRGIVSSRRGGDTLLGAIRDACVGLFVGEAKKEDEDGSGRNRGRKRNAQTMEACLGVLQELLLCAPRPGEMAVGVLGANFVPNLIASLGGSGAEGATNGYRAGVLGLVRALFRANPGASCASADLVRFVVAALDGGDTHPGTVLEAAKCAAAVATAVTAADASLRTAEDVGAGLARLLKRPGAPLDAKCVAIECLGGIISAGGSPPPPSRDALLAAVVEAADDEMTLLPALRALGTPAAAAAVLASPVAGPAVVVPRLLRSVAKIDRQAKQAGLRCLAALFAAAAATEDAQSLAAYGPQVVAAAGDLLEDADMNQSSVALRLATCAAPLPGCLQTLEDRVVPRAAALCQSQFMQPEALDTLCSFFATYAAAVGGVTKDAVLALATRLVSAAVDAKHSPAAVAAVVATVVAKTDKLTPAERLAFVSGSVLGLLAQGSSRAAGYALLGALGRVLDLSPLPLPSVAELLGQGVQDDAVREAAVAAVGRLCVGAPAHFVPAVLGAIATAAPSAQYHLVHALRTFAEEAAPAAVAPLLPQLLQTLGACASAGTGTGTDGLRKAAAECYGRLLLTAATMEATLQVLEEQAKAGCEAAFWAVHYALYRCEGNEHFRDVMRTHIPVFLRPIAPIKGLDPKANNNLRREALYVLNAAVRNAFPMVRDALAGGIAAVLGACVPVDALVTRTKVGPYELVVDEGTNTRKAALACLHSVLLQGGEDSLGDDFVPKLLAACAQGLRDTNLGVQGLALPILAHCLGKSTLRDAKVLAALEGVVVPLRNALEKLQRAQQDEEARELTAGLLRVVALVRGHAERDPYSCTLIKEHVPSFVGLLGYAERQFGDGLKEAGASK